VGCALVGWKTSIHLLLVKHDLNEKLYATFLLQFPNEWLAGGGSNMSHVIQTLVSPTIDVSHKFTVIAVERNPTKSNGFNETYGEFVMRSYYEMATSINNCRQKLRTVQNEQNRI
jgi:hypothetical protein